MKDQEKLKPLSDGEFNRFDKKIARGKSCWNWIGATQSRGYGHMILRGKTKLAHRISYEHYVGKIPEGLTIDHICRNTLCVNPEHLQPKTQKDNNLCGISPTAINGRKKTCVNGHELSGKNIKVQVKKDGTRRRCLLCEKIYKRRSRERSK